MRDWLTAQQIADLALPGLPSSKRGVLDLMARESWTTRPSTRRGGGVEIAAASLPAEARAAYAHHAIGRVAVPEHLAQEAAAAPGADTLAVPAAEGRDARLALIAAADRFRAREGLPLVAGDALFVAKYNFGTVPVDAWIRQSIPDLSTRTLQRWRKAVHDGAFARIAVDHGARRRGKGALEQEDVRVFILGCIARQPHLSADHVRVLVGERFPAFPLPAGRTFRLALTTWRERYKVELAKLTNPDAFRSKYRVSGTDTHQVCRLNELWMIDASPADVLTKDGRQSVYACVDLYSRRLKIYVSATPKAEAVGLLMRRAMLAWGVPERVKTDNGSDFRANRTKRLMASLGIEVDTSTAFSPWEKGQIERAIKTLQHDLMPILPGFIGHNVADRKVIEERRAFAERLGEPDDNVFCIDLTPAELQSHCDSWADGRYASRPHAGLHGATPQGAAAGSITPIRTVDERALDVLLAPIADGDGLRTVTKRGVQVKGRFYLAPSVLPDTRVLVRMDPADMGRALLFTDDGETYLGDGLCPELAGIDPAAFVATVRAEHNRILREGTAAIRAEMKSLTHGQVADMILREGARNAGVLVEFPRRTEVHETPALLAAAEAAEPTGAVPSQPAAAAEPPEGVTVLHPQDTPQLRFRRAVAIKARLDADMPVPAADAVWFGGYSLGSEFQTMRMLEDDFGEGGVAL